MDKPKREENRSKRIFVSYSRRELEQMQEDFANSSCRTLTQYIRAVSLKSPFDIYRNRAFDQFVEEVVLLRKEMQEIRQKRILMTEDEVRLIQLLEQIKDSINKLIDLCMLK
jgi:hypothetical protein